MTYRCCGLPPRSPPRCAAATTTPPRSPAPSPCAWSQTPTGRTAGWRPSPCSPTPARPSATPHLAPPLIEALTPHSHLIALDPLEATLITGSPARPLARLHQLCGQISDATACFALAEEQHTKAGLHLHRLQGQIDAHLALQPTDTDGLAALAAAADRLAARTLQAQAASHDLTATPLHLTARQRAVLAGLAKGETYQQIASNLGYAHTKIRKDVLATYRTLGVHNRHDAIATADQLGLLTS